MTSLTTSHGSSAQAHLPNKVHLGEGAIESRELGAIVPQKEDTPKAKPLAHFIAGGYVGNLPYTYNLKIC
jgi:solute carrier family 25, member 33/36